MPLTCAEMKRMSSCKTDLAEAWALHLKAVG